MEKKNPFTLYWFKAEWSQKRIEQNNKRYWDWEIKHNGFEPPQTAIRIERDFNEPQKD